MKFALCCLSLMLFAFRLAAVESREPEHDHDHDHGAPAHQPLGIPPAGHTHAHPSIDIIHPIVTESPVPETAFALRYSFADSGDGNEHALSASFEYAFVPSFSLELTVPYTVLGSGGAGTVGGLGNVEIAAKWATYQFADKGFLPTVGVAISFPTGNEERGIGSDHVVEFEPFVRAGYLYGSFQFVGALSLGIPLNQTSDERDEEKFTLSYNLVAIYRAIPNIQPMLELHGDSTFGDSNVTTLYVSPGVTFQPFDDKSINLGVGVSLPLTDDRDFDYAVNFLMIIHL